MSNSLNDISNNGGEFSKRKSDDKKQIISTDDKKNIIQKFQEQRQATKNLKEKNSIDEKIIESNIESNKDNQTQSIDSSLGSFNFQINDVNKSLFDRTALIDYARYVNPNQWIEYKQSNSSSKYFELNNTSAINIPVKGDTLEKDGLSIGALISWSADKPALQMRYQDFVYCKDLGQFPNNRMIVLRRFKNGVPDNLFDYYPSASDKESEYMFEPLSTMITWLKPEETPIIVTFNENWGKYSSGVLEILSNIASSMTGTGVINKALTTILPQDKEEDDTLLSDVVSAGLLELLSKNGGLKLDGMEIFGRSATGNPNLVLESQKRVTGGGGLSSDISFDIRFDYEMRYINKVDPGIVMLDLISNCLRMGTSVSEFRYNIPDFTTMQKKIENNKDFATATKTFIKNIGEKLGEVGKNFSDNINNALKSVKPASEQENKTNKSFTDDAFSHVISRYREQLKAAIAAETGNESGIWHVTIGNPKNPIVSCGDLIIKTSSLELGKELGYNDFPNSFFVKYSLESARTRGRNEIERIFNTGRGRIYVYKNIGLNPDYDQYKNQ